MVGLLGVDTGVCLCPLSFIQRGVVKHATVRTLGLHLIFRNFKIKILHATPLPAKLCEICVQVRGVIVACHLAQRLIFFSFWLGIC
jgi:sulfur relay (sulfurtransferase) complex TusBCD TusD component (DsrE family)